MEQHYFDGIKNMESFTRQDLLQSFRSAGFNLSYASFCKRLESLVKDGAIIRAGRNLYCFPKTEKNVYMYEYSEHAKKVAEQIKSRFPLIEFSIFELIQLNDFVNHQIANNVLFLSVEAEVVEFVFDTLTEYYPGKVLLSPTPEIYHRYWNENMIVVGKLITEAPKGLTELWHARLEKILVDIISDKILKESLGEGEYAEIYANVFSRYLVDKNSMFRYAKRRKAEEKIRNLIDEKTSINLQMKG